MELLAAQLRRQRRLENILAVHLLQLHVPPEQTNTKTYSSGTSVAPPEAATLAAESRFEKFSSLLKSNTSHGAHPASYLDLMDTDGYLTGSRAVVA